MRKALGFLSLGVATQIVMALNQLLLLPLQLSVWGHILTAEWYTAVAVGGLIGAADLGLRTARHREILAHADGSGSPADERHYLENWTAIRVLIVTGFIALFTINILISVFDNKPVKWWMVILFASIAIEAVIVIRIVYLDTLRRYTTAEMNFLAYVLVRLVLAFVSLSLFKADLTVLAIINLACALGAAAIQELVCRSLGLLRIFSAFSMRGILETLRIARHTASVPASTWVQIQLPVLVLSAFHRPELVTMFVSLRALMGLVRASIQQVGRFSSVEFQRIDQKRTIHRYNFIAGIICAGGILGVLAAICAVLDNNRLVGLWVKAVDLNEYQVIAMSCGVSMPFYSSLIITAILFRSGMLDVVAKKQYVYIAASLVFALVGIFSMNTMIYLSLVGTAEILLASMIMYSKLGRTENSIVLKPAVPAAACGALGVLAAVATVYMFDDYFVGMSGQDLMVTAMTGLLIAGLSVGAMLYCYRSSLPALAGFLRQRSGAG